MTPLPLLRVEKTFRPLLLAADRAAVANAVLGWMDSGLTVRTIRGRKTRTGPALFDEFAAALQFPLYFGENWAAFDECLSDLELLPRQAGFVILITESEQVLMDADPAMMPRLVDALRSAAQEWSEPIELGEWWDRPAVPFHVVLACTPEEADRATRRWADAGAEPVPFPR